MWEKKKRQMMIGNVKLVDMSGERKIHSLAMLIALNVGQIV
jgi:hypothetical protein